MNSITKVPNSTANGTKSTAKVTNIMAKTCIQVRKQAWPSIVMCRGGSNQETSLAANSVHSLLWKNREIPPGVADHPCFFTFCKYS